jgi:ketosteroid isomerase-like protein
MSQENVQVVRQAFEAFERGDVSAMVKDVDPEAIATAEAGVPGQFRGPRVHDRRKRQLPMERRLPFDPATGNEAQEG